MASELAMSYNLENKHINHETWKKIISSIPRSWCDAEKRSATDKWKGLSITELWVTLTDDQASQRTEKTFKSTPKLSWEESAVSPAPYPPAQHSYDDRKHGRDWDEGKAYAKCARHEEKSEPWSAWKPQHAGWKGDSSTWDKAADPPYSTKHESWRNDPPYCDAPGRHDKPQSDWHHSQQKSDSSTYYKTEDEKTAMAKRIEMMECEMTKMKEWHRMLE